ncbi:MAG: sugar phosphate isomerase/epimerase, partial [Ruthenibacterium sp.]
DFEKDYAVAQNCVAFMKEHGTKLMNIEPPRKQPGQIITEKDLLEVAEKCNKIGKLCQDNGIQLSLHPHWGTYIEREDQIDFFLANSNRAYVGLCLDTAHTTLCGMDPKHIYAKYTEMGVVQYVHLKDINADENSYPEYPPRRFRALGYGVVDFPGVVDILKKSGYDGVMCVELDFNRVNNYDSARRSKKYIHDVLGMQ